tara:strand:+ start:4576 stop:4884 length:309 start_codon:yes stop_codon:yes gene_type:complete
MKSWFIVLALLLCTGCSNPFVVFSAQQATQLEIVSTIKTGVDMALTADGQKSTNDIILSNLTNKDCKFTRAFDNMDVCLPIQDTQTRILHRDFPVYDFDSQN